MRPNATRAAPALVAVTLVILAATTAGAVTALTRENTHVTDLRAAATRVAELRDGVSDMAFAEAAYRRAPTDASWQRLETNMADVPPLLAGVRADGGRADQATWSSLALLHQRYVNQTRATRGQPVTGADDRVAGPALDAMRTLLQGVIDRYRRDITARTEQQAHLIHQMWILLPVAFAVALAILGWAFVLSGRERRRLTNDAEEARARALRDSLTGLPNRAALNAALDAAKPSSPTLLMLDLDGFKPVNDTWGHPAGDLVLQEVARRLRACLRSDDLAARMGGDEFAVLVTEAGGDVVEQRIRAAFTAPFDIGGHLVHVGASVGVACPRADSWTADDLVRDADQALYRAKRAVPRVGP